MKPHRFIWMALGLALFVTSCEQEVPENSGTGYLYMTSETDFSVIPVLKSGTGGDSEVTVKITDASGETVADFVWAEGMEPMPMSVGTYTAVATSGTSEPAAFDAPFYSATEEFAIEYGEVTNLPLVLTLDNVKVTAAFSENVTTNFSSYVLTVSNGLEGGELVYNMNAEGGSTLDKEGYFAATGTLTWSLALENNSGEVFEAITQTYNDVMPRQHYALNFDVQPEDEFGGGSFKVIVDDSMTDKEFDLVLDFVNKDVPKMQTDIDLGAKASYYTGDLTAKKFTITSPNSNDFTSLTLTSEAFPAAGLSETMELVGASADLLEQLAAAKIAITDVASGVYSIDFDFTEFVAGLPAGAYDIEFFAQNATGAYKYWTWSFEVKSSVETVSVNPWAKFAVLEGCWMSPEKPVGLTFAYKAAADSDWSYFDAASIVADETAKTFSAEVPLNSATGYVFKAVTDYEAATKEITFTTETEQTIPNLSFDIWTSTSDGLWYPNATSDDSSYNKPELNGTDFIWDSANSTIPVVGGNLITTTPVEEPLAPAGGLKAAKLESILVNVVGIKKFAAGNIYTGNFGKATTNPMGAELQWGVQFKSRPLALKGWYDYRPVNVDQGSYAEMSGKTDIGQIQIMLTDWTGPFQISTGNNQFVDINANYIIGYGTMDLNETSGYTEFEIKVDYRDKTRKPTYIVIVGAASKYGDYFTGGVGSTLYLDEFELVY